MRTVALHGSRAQGRVALVDDEDYDTVSQYRWWVQELLRPSGAICGPYAYTTLHHRRPHALAIHELITGYPMTDHIDHDGLNNQRSNLRPATRAQNAQNQRPQTGHSSRFKGVTWHRGRRKWQAEIRPDGKKLYLGLFADEIDAAAAYNQAALTAWGEYAYLNEIAVLADGAGRGAG